MNAGSLLLLRGRSLAVDHEHVLVQHQTSVQRILASQLSCRVTATRGLGVGARRVGARISPNFANRDSFSRPCCLHRRLATPLFTRWTEKPPVRGETLPGALGDFGVSQCDLGVSQSLPPLVWTLSFKLSAPTAARYLFTGLSGR